MRRQLGKSDFLAVRSDEKECVVIHQDIPSDSNFRCPGLQKKDADASKYAQQGYRYFSCWIKEVAPSLPEWRIVCGALQAELLGRVFAFVSHRTQSVQFIRKTRLLGDMTPDPEFGRAFMARLSAESNLREVARFSLGLEAEPTQPLYCAKHALRRYGATTMPE
jgi:hypothetical protein